MNWKYGSDADNASGKPRTADGKSDEIKREEESVIAMPSEAQEGRRVTRSHRRHIKLQEENIEDGAVRCPVCFTGIQMADGGCNVTTCTNTAKHDGRFYYFCAHCKAECPNGESYCRECPERNDKQTRRVVQARKKRERQAFLDSNSADNPCEVED